MFQKGGGEVQLLQTKSALESYGHEVLFFDQWKPQVDIDVFHQFSTEQGVEHVIKKYRELEIPVAVSTIMWTPPPHGDHHFWRVQQIMLWADALMTNSDIESRRLSKHFEIDLGKFIKTRNSISTAYAVKSSANFFRKEFNIEGSFVLSVANIDRRKNTKLLVAACKDLGVKLVTIGHVKDPDYYNEFKDSYQGHTHLGPIEDEKTLKSAYAACSVYALPSLCETPGIAALEAASQGAVIVITSEGSTSEYFGNDVIYVDHRSVESIRAGIAEGLKAGASSDLADRIVSDYSWSNTAKEVLDGYNRILRNK